VRAEFKRLPVRRSVGSPNECACAVDSSLSATSFSRPAESVVSAQARGLFASDRTYLEVGGGNLRNGTFHTNGGSLRAYQGFPLTRLSLPMCSRRSAHALLKDIDIIQTSETPCRNSLNACSRERQSFSTERIQQMQVPELSCSHHAFSELRHGVSEVWMMSMSFKRAWADRLEHIGKDNRVKGKPCSSERTSVCMKSAFRRFPPTNLKIGPIRSEQTSRLCTNN